MNPAVITTMIVADIVGSIILWFWLPRRPF